MAKDKAFRTLNWCSYMARTTGSVIEGPFEFVQNANHWYSDGHGDYIRHFMLAMGGFPEWAPASEKHLLRSTSVVKSVTYAATSITYSTFDAASTFSTDWRAAMMPLWKPQQTEQEAEDLAHLQLREFLKLSPRRGKETAFIREPTAAAWIVTLCPDANVVQRHAADLERVIAHYDYAQLYYWTFFWVEGAWWRLKDTQ